MRKRAGKSLVEMVVVIGMMAVILSVAFTTLHAVMRSESLGITALATASNRTRLARKFRSDVHAAKSASVVPADDAQSQSFRLQNPDGTRIVYVGQNEVIVRTHHQDDSLRSRETFRLSTGETRFSVDNQTGLLDLVHVPVVALPSDKSSVGPTSPELRAQAVLGYDHRFLNESGDSSTDESDPPSSPES